MKLSSAEKRLLLALAAGCTLKSHRSLDGSKVYKLHSLGDEAPQAVAWETVDRLRAHGFIDSNKKFPAATYLLTDKGAALAASLGSNPDDLPLTASGWN